MDENPTVVNLAEVRSSTTTSTGSTRASEQTVSSQATPPTASAGGHGHYNYSPVAPAPSEPSGTGYGSKAIIAAIAFLYLWLGTVTFLAFNESKEIREKVSANQEELLKQISSSQIDIKNQISEFERRHEADMRELQKMILQQQNHNSNPPAN